MDNWIIRAINDYNEEGYIALSPKNENWRGSYYSDTNFSEVKNYFIDPVSMAFNLEGFGTFNRSKAVITAYYSYDAKSKMYYLKYKYYIVDYYDLGFIDEFEEMNALALACTYELYGVYTDEIAWKKQ